MKYYHYIFILILFFSCSKDNIDTNPIVPIEKIIINPITITNENLYSFQINGSFTNNEKLLIVESGFVVDTIPNPNLEKKMVKVLSANDNNILKSGISNLLPNKKLFVKAYIKTENKLYYSEQLIHTTLKDNPYYMTDNITISTQDELLKFASHHYTSIIKKGWNAIFTITGSVNDLSPLKDLEIIQSEGFEIKNSLISNLAGLNNVRTITSLGISANDNLVDLAGLDNLKNCEWLQIIANNNLKTFNSLNELTTIYGSLYISNNLNLVNINGLNKLKALYEIYITNNPKLKNLVGLSSLETIAWESFYITNNQSLESFTGLDKLKKVGQLQIENNENLKNLNGLENIEEVSFYINILNNPNLVDLTGLSNLKTTQYLSIKNNPKLLSLSGLSNSVIIQYLFIANNQSLLNLTKIGNITSKIMINDNENLTSLIGLQNVQYLGGSLNEAELTLHNNNSLIDLKGLEGLKQVNGYGISIYNNANLNSLNGFETLESKSVTTSFYVYNNPKLSNYCALKNYISKTGFNLYVHDNLFNPTAQTIFNNCQ